MEGTGLRVAHALAQARRRRKAGRALLGTVAALALTPVLQVWAMSFSNVYAPFVTANDFITGLPTCMGPTESGIGILQDKNYFFVGDICNGTMYRFPATGGVAPADVQASLQNNLAGGMATDGSTYYAVNLSATTPLVQQFNPLSLAPGAVVMTAPQRLRDLVYDPQNKDLYATGDDGIWQIQNPSSNPTVTLVVAATSGDAFDGLAITPDYSALWVAAHGDTQLRSYSIGSFTQTHQLTPKCGGPDGMAIAPPNTLVGGLDVSNDVFVNCNDGQIRMLSQDGTVDNQVAANGSRGDFATVGLDGYMYATQGDRVEQLVPGFFGAHYGARAIGLDLTTPQASQTKSDTYWYSNPSGGSTEVYTAFANVPPFVAAWTMRSDARTWATGEARAESTIAEVDIDTGTGHTIQAQSLDAIADTTCSHSVAGVSTIGQLTIDGQRTEPLQAQNVIITLGTVVVTLNEITITGSAGTAQETRTTSLHVVGPNLDLRLAVADAAAAPC